MPVMSGGRMVGLLTLEHVSEMIMVNNALSPAATQAYETPRSRGAAPAVTGLH